MPPASAHALCLSIELLSRRRYLYLPLSPTHTDGASTDPAPTRTRGFQIFNVRNPRRSDQYQVLYRLALAPIHPNDEIRPMTITPKNNPIPLIVTSAQDLSCSHFLIALVLITRGDFSCTESHRCIAGRRRRPRETVSAPRRGARAAAAAAYARDTARDLEP